MLFQNKNMKLMIEQINLFLTYLHSCNLFKDSAPFFKSIKKASIFNKNYKDKNEQHFQILKVQFLCEILGGDCILTRGLTESVLFVPKPRAGLRRRALPVADAARRGWRSGQNMV